MSERMGIAVIGTGRIAWRFAADLRHSARARIVAVGGRDRSRAQRLAAAIGPQVAASDVHETMARDDVAAVYVATANALHVEHALMAIAAGKPVLVEKPLATSLRDAQSVADAARSAGVFAMEAMWMRFTPGIRRLKALVDEGRVGAALHLQAGVAFRHDGASAETDGALLDLGVYPISLALHLLGSEDRVTAIGHRSPRGDIREADILLQHGTATSNLSCSWRSEGANRASLRGERGFIETGGSMLCPPLLAVRDLAPATGPASQEPRSPSLFAIPHAFREALRPLRQRRVATLYQGTGLHYQVDHMTDCLSKGLLESPVMPLHDSCRTLDIIEDASAQIRKA